MITAINLINREHPNWSLANLYAKGMSDTRQINIIPFMESYGFVPSDIIKAQVFEKENRIAQPLRGRRLDAAFISG